MIHFSWVKLEMPHMWELWNCICPAKMLKFYVKTLVLGGFKVLHYHRYLFPSLLTTVNLIFLFKACIHTLLQETQIFLKVVL